jgi:hypothetical protein
VTDPPIFLGVGFGVFAGVFGEMWWQDVVFLWSVCGEMCGKTGLWAVTFWDLKNRHIFRIYFLVRKAVRASLEGPNHAMYGWVLSMGHTRHRAYEWF